MDRNLRKIVVVGDGGCGKTCLLAAYSTNEFLEDHIPTIFDTFYKECEIDEQCYKLALWDTAGEEDYDRLRPLSYPRTDIVLICFGIERRESLQNVMQKWAAEIKYFLPHVPVILVGTKLDLRNEAESILRAKTLTPRYLPVAYSEGKKVATLIKAEMYLECSAKYLIGIKNIFEEAVRLSNQPKKKCFFKNCIYL